MASLEVSRKRPLESNFPAAKKRFKVESLAPRHPNICSTITPRDKKSCLDRYKTFSLTKWNGKSKEAGAWACARYGWICTGYNVLKCVGCGAKARDFSHDNTKAENFRHEDGCVFDSNPSPKEFAMLGRTKVECQEEFIRNLKTFNFTDGRNNFLIPAVSEETQGTLVAELPENKQDMATDAMLLAACGWQLRDRRPKGGLATSEHLRLTCSCCQMSFPLSSLRLQNTPEIIPDKTSALEKEKAVLNPFSIDAEAPAFGRLTKTLSRVSIWEDESPLKLGKRKLDDDRRNVKKKRTENDQIATPSRKRTRGDESESNLKKRKLIEAKENISKKRDGNSKTHNDRVKRRKTVLGFKHSSPKTFDPLLSHRPSCPYIAHHSYTTGNGETPGYVHSLRCIEDILNSGILRGLLS